jgi:hypothetical protein
MIVFIALLQRGDLDGGDSLASLRWQSERVTGFQEQAGLDEILQLADVPGPAFVLLIW